MEAGSRWALVLAGGDGARLQELTRAIVGRPIPKQYCRLLGDRTLLDATFSRTAHFAGPQRSLLVVNQNHLAVGAEAMHAVPARNIVVQPCNRDTGPGILLGLLHLARRDPNATVAMFPCDHFVSDDRLFMEYVRAAAEMVSRWPDRIAVLGIEPEEADAELGYISVGRRVAGTPKAYLAEGFEEKPSGAGLHTLVEQGALWNSFVMVFRVRRMLELLRAVLPEQLGHVRRLSASVRKTFDGYGDLTPWSFSRQFLAKITAHLVVVKVEGVHWSDWGTRAAIERTMFKLKQPLPWLPRIEPAA